MCYSYKNKFPKLLPSFLRKKPACQPVMRFAAGIIESIKDSIGSMPAESGGALFGYRRDFVVRKFIYDDVGKTTGGTYEPGIEFLNEQLRIAREEGYDFLGFIHSHPPSFRKLSGVISESIGTGDLGYIKKIFKAMPSLEKILMPLVVSGSDSEFEIIPYIANRKNPEDYKLAALDIISEETPKTKVPMLFDTDMSRLLGAVNLELMKKVKVVAVGCGGANELYKLLVRCGLEHLVTIDYDTVDLSNLHSQGWYIPDIGVPKVEALGRHIANINPNVSYTGYNADFMQMDANAYDEILGNADIIMGMTDSFHCQAFVNKMAIKYNKPAIYAQMYHQGRCSEITFTIPGITPACNRCATSSRYAAYEDGYKNNVTSTGTTMCHNSLLNGATGILTLAILNRNEKNCDFGGWFGDYFDRNLVQLAMYPGYGKGTNNLFERIYSNIPYAYTFNPIWQKVEAEDASKYECPCPDCFGLGDLNKSHEVIKLLQAGTLTNSDWVTDKRLRA